MRQLITGLALTCACLMPLPAVADDDLDLDLLTPHGSELDINHVDEALIGTWVMVKGQLESPAGTLDMVASGRQLSILASGSFQENYATEASGFEPDHITLGQVFGDGIDRYAPRATCQIRASGLSVGDMTHHEELNLDIDPPIVDAMFMHVTLNKSASTDLEVRCHDSPELRGNMVTPPLGYGYTQTGGSGPPYVAYYYKVHPLVDPATMEVLNPWYGLEIWSAPSPQPVVARYFFVRG